MTTWAEVPTLDSTDVLKDRVATHTCVVAECLEQVSKGEHIHEHDVDDEVWFEEPKTTVASKAKVKPAALPRQEARKKVARIPANKHSNPCLTDHEGLLAQVYALM